MKTKLLAGLATGLFMLGTAGMASAIPVSWSDSIDFDPDVLVESSGSYSYSHDISDNGFLSQWMDTGGTDTITGFDLQVSIIDDNKPNTSNMVVWVLSPNALNIPHLIPKLTTITVPDSGETAKISYGSEEFSYTFGSGLETYTENIMGVMDIWADGTLEVTVSSTSGDFLVAASSLTVYGNDGMCPTSDPASPVPEPATMLLFGTGLAGLAGAHRRKTAKK